jgi:putative colanic acid biosysnthesis UDP-glucose lipid carrier transferase
MFAKILSHEQSTLLSLAVKIMDILLYIGCGLLVFYCQFQSLDVPQRYQIALLWGVLLFYPVFCSFDIYKSLRGKKALDYLQSMLVAFAVVMLLLAASAFITKTGEYYSREWFLLWHASTVTALLLLRLVLLHVLRTVRTKGMNHKRIVIVGDGTVAADMGRNSLFRSLVSTIKNTAWSGFDIVALFNYGGTNGEIADIQVQSLPADISSYVKEHNVVEVWLIPSLWQRHEADELIKKLSFNVITVRYFPDLIGAHLLEHSLTEILGFPAINIVASPMTGANQLVKAIEDRVLSLLILILISPVMLLVAALVKLSSSGPIFYRQKRVGWNGKEFEMLKFRSMPVDAEQQTGAVWAKAEDKRATKIGTLLRKTSLDELPQFINVLKGDMSIVGPRPERLVFVEQFKHEVPQYMQKHLVKAGITGWAQVNGWRGNTSLEKRIEHDLYYINHWSLWFDLKIIFLTVLRGFINRNAY